MKVLVVGSAGNMGRRYISILKTLKVPFVGIDAGEKSEDRDFTHAIVATPTEIHLDSIQDVIQNYGIIKILCEKPLCKNTKQLEYLKLFLSAWEVIKLDMVQNYAFASDLEPEELINSKGHTVYDYFNSGKDGKDMDCIQLIALASGSYELHNDSPVWKCMINGIEIRRGDIDLSYCRMIEHWLSAKPMPLPIKYLMTVNERVTSLWGF